MVRDHHILLIHTRDDVGGATFWVLPGGGDENGETGEQCVCREVREETGLDVIVDRVLLDEDLEPNTLYRRVRTYLCLAPDGDPVPGHEPEVEFVATILEASWFDLRSLEAWPPLALGNQHLMRWVGPIRASLGYA